MTHTKWNTRRERPTASNRRSPALPSVVVSRPLRYMDALRYMEAIQPDLLPRRRRTTAERHAPPASGIYGNSNNVAACTCGPCIYDTVPKSETKKTTLISRRLGRSWNRHPSLHPAAAAAAAAVHHRDHHGHPASWPLHGRRRPRHGRRLPCPPVYLSSSSRPHRPLRGAARQLQHRCPLWRPPRPSWRRQPQRKAS